MIATCVAGGVRDFFREGETSGASEDGAQKASPQRATTKITLPLFSANNDAIGDPAATGMLGHAFMPPRDVVMLPHAMQRWAIPPCCVKDDGGRMPPIPHII